MTSPAKSRPQSKLPSKPSALIRLALDDLKACERDPAHYRVDMGRWVRRLGPDSEVCEVCLGGAVMVQRLGARERALACHNDYGITPATMGRPHGTQALLFNKLMAINEFRTGSVLSGLSRLGEGTHQSLSDTVIPRYSARNRVAFHAAMRKMARNLAQRGL